MTTSTDLLAFRPKYSYHPYFLLAFHLNILPDHLLLRIPKSTRHDWKQKNTQLLFGYDWYLQHQSSFTIMQQVFTNEKLLQINKALLRVIALTRFLKKYSTRIKEHIGNAGGVVLGNINKNKKVLPLQVILKYLQLPYPAYLQLKRQACRQSLLNLCRLKHPAQLLSKEVAIIKSYCTDACWLHWPLSSVYHQLIRDKAAAFTISTFYKYVSLLKLQRVQVPHRRKNHHTGIRAAAPLQIIHADATIYRTLDNAKNYIYLVQDNYSRAILGHRVAQSCKAQYVFENLAAVKEQYLQPAGMASCQLITDDGSENQGAVHFLTSTHEPPFIEHLIAQQDIEFSNSMIEAANKQLKYRFLYHRSIPDFAALQKFIAQAIEDYNNRPQAVLNGLTPLEVLNGKRYDKETYRQQIYAAKANRMAHNKRTSCCSYSF
ncbi:hypothetical protein HB364_16230 [Pseudoflavitalea sp. X16]|uniref:integrase core domain-containing protein n=1 Tax=Paraflavitalea devenefica TaxID=2716334 RepID=UPI001420DD77|nr:integrase core domain-containing protein [Paraflavitalea devenefica]NII26638.1 hypothetical protein [Paraflavitalea devenefica]